MRVSLVIAAMAIAGIAGYPVMAENPDVAAYKNVSTYENKSVQIATDDIKWRDATEAEVRKRYANRTVTYTTVRTDRTIKRYFKDDGTYDTVCCAYDWNYRNEGVWSVKGNEICQTGTSGPRAGMKSCVKLVTDGKTLKRKSGENMTKNRSWEEGNKLP